MIPWYSRPWKCVLRHPDAKVRAEIARQAKAAAQNNLVGYDQSDRYTFWQHLAASNYDPAQITIACEVIAGKWGNGQERISRLKKAGYDPKTVQNRVNELC